MGAASSAPSGLRQALAGSQVPLARSVKERKSENQSLTRVGGSLDEEPCAQGRAATRAPTLHLLYTCLPASQAGSPDRMPPPLRGLASHKRRAFEVQVTRALPHIK